MRVDRRFDESFSLGEDDEFILRLVQAGELAAVAAPLVGYRRHATNMTNAAAVDRRKASERLIHLHIANAEARGDARSAALLRENLRRWTERASAECVGSLVSGMRAGRTRLVLNELRWAGTTAPASTARAFLTRGLGALPGRAGAARRAVREAP